MGDKPSAHSASRTYSINNENKSCHWWVVHTTERRWNLGERNNRLEQCHLRSVRYLNGLGWSECESPSSQCHWSIMLEEYRHSAERIVASAVRDLSPEKVFLSGRSTRERAYLSDRSIAYLHIEWLVVDKVRILSSSFYPHIPRRYSSWQPVYGCFSRQTDPVIFGFHRRSTYEEVFLHCLLQQFRVTLDFLMESFEIFGHFETIDRITSVDPRVNDTLNQRRVQPRGDT